MSEDRSPGRSRGKERTQEGMGPGGKAGSLTAAGPGSNKCRAPQGGVTGSAPVSDPAFAANAPKIAGGCGAGSAAEGREGRPASQRSFGPGLPPAEPPRRAPGEDPEDILGKPGRGGRGSPGEEEEEKEGKRRDVFQS